MSTPAKVLKSNARAVQIYKLNVQFDVTQPAQNAIKIVATVSKGTYIRTLGEDIGEALGCGAHLSSLRRIETGGLQIDQALTLAQLEALSDDERMAVLQPVDSLLAGHTAVTLDSDNAGRFLSGLRRRTALPDNDHVAVYGPSTGLRAGDSGQATKALLGSAHIKAGELIPTRLLSPIEVSQTLAQESAVTVLN